MPRDFNDAQGQRWTARQVGVFLEGTPPASAEAPESPALPADVEFRAATGATVHGVLPNGELYRASEEALRDILEKALGNQRSLSVGDKDAREAMA